MSDRDALSPKEIASRLGIHYRTVLAAIERGDLVAFDVGAGENAAYRIDMGEYERWRHMRPARPEASHVAPSPRRRPRTTRLDVGTSADLKAIEGGRA